MSDPPDMFKFLLTEKARHLDDPSNVTHRIVAEAHTGDERQLLQVSAGGG